MFEPQAVEMEQDYGNTNMAKSLENPKFRKVPTKKQESGIRFLDFDD
jgi:hypothetical protein